MTEHVEIYGQTITPDVEERLTQRRTQAEAQAEARALQAEALSMPLLAAQDRAKSRIQNAKAWCEARDLPHCRLKTGRPGWPGCRRHTPPLKMKLITGGDFGLARREFKIFVSIAITKVYQHMFVN